MRITFALPLLRSHVGGLRVVSLYARHLHDKGHQVTLVVRLPEQRMPGWRGRLQRLGLISAPRKPIPPEQGYFSGLDVPVIWLDETRPVVPAELPDADVIISTWWTTTEWVDQLPASKGRHVHFIQDHEDFRPETSARVQAVYRQKNHKIVVAQWLGDVMRQRYGADSDLVLNGVDLGHFTAPPRGRGHPPQVGCLYAAHPRKNFDLAARTLIALKDRRPELRATVFGSQERPAILPDWVSYEQSPDQARIPAIYASCDLWLFASKTEGYGLPLLEAMACRTPVIACAAGAAPDLIADGQNGRLLPTGIDAQTMADAAAEFLDRDDAAWQAASKAAWQTAQAHDLSYAAQAFEDNILRIAKR